MAYDTAGRQPNGNSPAIGFHAKEPQLWLGEAQKNLSEGGSQPHGLNISESHDVSDGEGAPLAEGSLAQDDPDFQRLSTPFPDVNQYLKKDKLMFFVVNHGRPTVAEKLNPQETPSAVSSGLGKAEHTEITPSPREKLSIDEITDGENTDDLERDVANTLYLHRKFGRH